MRIIYILITSFILFSGSLYGQDLSQIEQKPESKKFRAGNFFISGNGYYNFQLIPLLSAAVNPIILWKPTKRIFFEGEIGIELEGSDLKIDVGYATLHYILNKYITIGAGKFLSPFGTYQERFHPAWVNKFQQVPLGFSHEGKAVGPTAEMGIELCGGLPLGGSKMNYVAYVSNGPALNTKTGDTLMAGMLEYGKLIDNNFNKAVGGRFGLLPYPNSSLELGISFQYAKVGDRKDTIYRKAKARMLAFDISYVKSFTSIKGNIDIKGQYNREVLDKANSSSSTDSMGSENMFDLNQAYYLQFSYRPSMLRKKFIRNIELAVRYSSLDSKPQGMKNVNISQFSVGINYWFSWRTVIKFAYQLTLEKEKKNNPAFLIQFAFAHPQFKFKRKKSAKTDS